MVGLIKSVLVGLLISVWLTIPVAIADQSFDVRSSVQTHGEDASSALTIAPELTNPAEIPLTEVQSEPISLFTGFDSYALTPAERAKPSTPDASENTIETTLEHWLSSFKRLIEGN
ncbi:hypothetical protein N836_27055 [Leptolyngbya sp. Heron Island J]|uniref:hypothetical protein n=1 Tax=Leptolyngbya sp. Heron Island J TaxID=1385935 RepID=UPI0003B961C4|nr:hypothetical protein [Leptolyngbya sp. Heron Island J]ESA32250.1 hypothetical protein N836_27055 [Leptolyngbya sp. Heron Island J]